MKDYIDIIKYNYSKDHPQIDIRHNNSQYWELLCANQNNYYQIRDRYNYQQHIKREQEQRDEYLAQLLNKQQEIEYYKNQHINTNNQTTQNNIEIITQKMDKLNLKSNQQQ